MDGYAVRLADVTNAGARLKVIGTAPAGKPFEDSVGTGQAIRIFTGAEIPDGCDHVVIQEDTVREEEIVYCKDGYSASQFVRLAGRDFSIGDTLLAAGIRLGAAALAIAAAENSFGSACSQMVTN